jgi:hypothetical protein
LSQFQFSTRNRKFTFDDCKIAKGTKREKIGKEKQERRERDKDRGKGRNEDNRREEREIIFFISGYLRFEE